MSSNKFHHEMIYRGDDLPQKLAKQIVICGAGAIGSNLVDNLVRQGCSRIRVIDMDRVETHNLNTQTFDEADIGSFKANAVMNKAFNAVGVEVDVESKELKKSNIKKFLKGADLVIDAFDNTASRKLLQDHCRTNKIPCLHAGMHTDYGEVVWDEYYMVPQDGGEDICDYPLARNLVMFVVALASEEIVNFCLERSERRSLAIALGDLTVRPYR